MKDINRKNKISVLGALSLSVGTAIGWGSFVVTCSSFLSEAGPLGSTIAIIIGAIIMLVLAYNYHYMINKYPDSNGGIYVFAKNTLGGDHAFLASWFLIITYAAILWANVSSISLLARNVFGNLFQFGFHYVICGYEIYLGEILLSAFFLFIITCICLLRKRIFTSLQSIFVVSFVTLIVVGFIAAAVMHQGGVQSYQPYFLPVENNKAIQIVAVIGMMPWAFIGFESISHSSKDFEFRHRHVFKMLAVSIIVSALIYILLCVLLISIFPDEYANWYEYLSSSSKLSGLDGIPAFYVIHRYLGVFGLVMFIIALMAIILSSIIGNMVALSNLLHSMAEDDVMPKWFKKEDKNANPRNCIITVSLLAFVMLFFGRVLIGWIVDVNTICGIIVYAYISIITISESRKEKTKAKDSFAFGIIGLALCILFSIFVIANDIINSDYLSTESLLIFLIWAVVGFIYYGFLLKRDQKNLFGNSMIALFGLFILIVYMVGTWIFKGINKYGIGVANINIRIILGGVLLISTQIILFYAFSIITKRESNLHDKLVLGMATMVEGKDNSTGGHIKRTSDVVKIISEEMAKDPQNNLRHSFFRNIIKAAPMHDLGKISIDDIILRKPGRFTPEEYEEMKKHSPEGARILNKILEGLADKAFETIAVNIAHYHHERWDGKGYPSGLKGDQIPLEARIMAIADVYDALVSKRVYKDEFSFENAYRIIMENMGTQFDPGLEKYFVFARKRIEQYYTDIKDADN